MDTGALAGFGIQPDPAAVELDDLAAESESDSRAVVLVAGVQTLEDDEDLLGELGAIPIPLSVTVKCQTSSSRTQPTVITHGSSARRNFTAFPIRFCQIMARVVPSPFTSGSVSSRTTVVPDSSMTSARLASARSSERSRSTVLQLSWTRPTREKVSRSLMSTCMRLAPSTAKSMYCLPRASSSVP